MQRLVGLVTVGVPLAEVAVSGEVTSEGQTVRTTCR